MIQLGQNSQLAPCPTFPASKPVSYNSTLGEDPGIFGGIEIAKRANMAKQSVSAYSSVMEERGAFLAGALSFVRLQTTTRP